MGLDVHAIAASRLGAVGQRYTTSRRTVVDTLQAAGRPLTIPEILADNAQLPQSSAYRTLAVLTQAGVVRRVVAVDEFARFELAEDLSSHHHHLLCTSCGLVADFELPPTWRSSSKPPSPPRPAVTTSSGCSTGSTSSACARPAAEPPGPDAPASGQWVRTAKKSRDSAVGGR